MGRDNPFPKHNITLFVPMKLLPKRRKLILTFLHIAAICFSTILKRICAKGIDLLSSFLQGRSPPALSCFSYLLLLLFWASTLNADVFSIPFSGRSVGSNDFAGFVNPPAESLGNGIHHISGHLGISLSRKTDLDFVLSVLSFNHHCFSFQHYSLRLIFQNNTSI